MAVAKETPRGAWMVVYVVAGIAAVLVVVSIFQIRRARRNEDRWRRVEQDLQMAGNARVVLKKIRSSSQGRAARKLRDLSWFTSDARRVDPKLVGMTVKPGSEVYRDDQDYTKVFANVTVQGASYNRILDFLFNMDRHVAEYGMRCSEFRIDNAKGKDQWRLTSSEFAAYAYRPQSAQP